jgi:hypothetical protein
MGRSHGRGYGGKPSASREGDKAAWSDSEIGDVIAFLKTLTDRDVEPVDSAQPE